MKIEESHWNLKKKVKFFMSDIPHDSVANIELCELGGGGQWTFREIKRIKRLVLPNIFTTTFELPGPFLNIEKAANYDNSNASTLRRNYLEIPYIGNPKKFMCLPVINCFFHCRRMHVLCLRPFLQKFTKKDRINTISTTAWKAHLHREK